jgi:LacI family transcriptional regulator
VMGVDDLPSAQLMLPGLTTIRLDLYQLGVRAVDNVLALFRKEQASCHEILPVSLVVRESTGPARAG